MVKVLIDRFPISDKHNVVPLLVTCELGMFGCVIMEILILGVVPIA